MTGEGKGRIRVSTALDTDYEAESCLLGDLEKTDEAARGRLLRALVRAGFKDSRSNAVTAQAGRQGDDHGT